MNHSIRFTLFILAMFFFANSEILHAEPKTPAKIKIFQYNILADVWADPAYYPTGAAQYLDKDLRRKAVINTILNFASGADIIALAETTIPQFDAIKAALGNGYSAFQANHEPYYWADWVTPANPWQLNGVAIFVKKTSFSNIVFKDLPLSSSGNHCAYLEAVQTDSKRKIRAASIHLDSDYAYNRNHEINALLDYMYPIADSIDIIAGDFNSDTQKAEFSQDLEKTDFVDIMASLGLAENTSPYTDSYYKSSNWGIIDHVIVRNAIPVTGAVFSQGFDAIADQDARIIEQLEHGGSDHYPITATAQP